MQQTMQHGGKERGRQMSHSDGFYRSFEPRPKMATPLRTLLTDWWASCPVQPTNVAFWREQLYAAILEEIRIKAGISVTYNPASDLRVAWANQVLEVKEGTRPKIDSNIRASAWFLLAAAPTLCGKDLAAGEKPQTLTLGS